MEEQQITVVDDKVIISTPQPPVQVSYSREVLQGMIIDAQARIDSNTADRDNYQSMLDMLPEEKSSQSE